MKHLYITFLITIISQINVFGQIGREFTVDGINYRVTSTNPATVEVARHDTTFAGSANIPATVTNALITYSVTRIGVGAFALCHGLTSVSIPNSVIDIGQEAFVGSSGLTSVNIPNSVTSLRTGTFGYCSKLTSISIPNSVTSIGELAFSGCSSLTSVSIPNSVTSIGYSAFSNCSSLNSIYIPAVTSIGESAFSGCSGLTSVTVNWTVPLTVNTNVFKNVPSSAVTLYVPDGTQSAYSSVPVWKDFKIKVFVQNFTVDGINYRVTSISPATVEVARNTSFTGIADVPVTVKNESFTYSVTSIGESAFFSCSGLTSVNIPNSVTSIGDVAFFSCSGLTSVNIPNSVKSVGDFAFEDCSVLTSVTVNWTTPLYINVNVFDNVTLSKVTLNVPDGTQTAYSSAPVWKEFMIKTTTGINGVELNNKEPNVCPNPASNYFTINSTNDVGSNFTYNIVDVTGRTVTGGSSSYNEPITIESLSAGLYILQVTTERGKHASTKLIKY
jgi:hypothetical protein